MSPQGGLVSALVMGKLSHGTGQQEPKYEAMITITVTHATAREIHSYPSEIPMILVAPASLFLSWCLLRSFET